MEANELIERFEFFDDWQDRYRYLIDLGRKLSAMDDALKTEESRVTGCMSQVWLVHSVESGEPRSIVFVADSDSHIVKGLIAVLLILYSGRTPRHILDVDIGEVFKRLGLDQHLSPNRRNGFYSMVGRIRAIAEATA